MLLIPPLRLVIGPFAQIMLSVRLKNPRAGPGQRQPPGFMPPTAGSLSHAVISAVEQQIAQVNRLENGAAFGIKFSNAFHEKRAEPGEEVAGDYDPRADQRTSSLRQRRQALDEFGQRRLKLGQRARRASKLLPLLPQSLQTARRTHYP